MVKIFPLIFGRIGGCAIEALDSLRSHRCEAYAAKFAELSNEIAVQRSSLIEKLYAEINNEQNECRRNGILNFKRDLYNNRPRAERSHLALAFREDIQSDISNLFQKKQEYVNLVTEFGALFCVEESNSVEELNSLTTLSFFRNALLFSSQVLLQELTKRPGGKGNTALITAQLRYLTRSITKTTPFSTFNSIFFLQRTSEKFTSGELCKNSVIQLSNLFYFYLKRYLLKNPSFRNKLQIKVNSTLWIENEPAPTYHLFQNDENDESFKKLQCSPTLLAIQNLLGSKDMTYEEFVRKLRELSAADKDVAENFIGILLKEGFLKIIFPVSCTSTNWISQLSRFLDKHPIDTALEELNNLLRCIDYAITSLEDCMDVEVRYKKMLELHNTVRSFFKLNDPDSGFLKNVTAQDLFYEDHFIYVQERIGDATVTELLSDIKQAFLCFNSIPGKRLRRLALARKIHHTGRIPVLHFYERFYLPAHQNYDFLAEELTKLEKVISAVTNRIEKRFNEHSIDISDLIAQDNHIEQTTSFGVYLQTEDDAFQQVVVNNFCPGYGANICRFLNSLPEKYAKQLMEYNNALVPDKIIAEIKDASIHNVGTFPRVTEALVDLCDDRDFNRSYRMISLADIFVSVTESGDLILVDANDKNIRVLNFSLEGLNRRSAFYRFIDLFNDTDLFGLNHLLGTVNRSFEDRLSEKKIVHLPRIKFRDRLIVQRRRWLMLKTTILSIINRAKTNGENFLNLNFFMSENGVPAEVFIKFATRNLKKPQDDKYKPQYFNFKLPVFTALFIDQLNKAGDVIEISEMFPTSLGVRKTGGRVKEYIFNCN